MLQEEFFFLQMNSLASLQWQHSFTYMHEFQHKSQMTAVVRLSG